MRYIDAKKLKKAIEEKGLDCSFAVKMERLDTLALIDELQQEQPDLPGIEKSGIPGKDYIPVEWVDACEKYGKWKIVKQEQPELYKDESLGSPDYERGFKHGRDYQTHVERKYTNKDKVIAYLVDKGYPVSTNGEIPTYQETFDMINNAIKHANKQEQPIDKNTLTWRDVNEFERIINRVHYEFPHGIGEEAFGKLVLERFIDGKDDLQEQPEMDIEKEIEEHSEQMPMSEFTHEREAEEFTEWARKEFHHFYELGLNVRKED